MRPKDVLPPRTTLAIGTPQYGSSPPLFIAPQTPLSLSSVDDALTAGDAAGAGTAATYWAVDSGTFAVYAGSFTVGMDGLHWVYYYSVDKVGNTEAVRASSIAVDGTAPASTLAAGSPQAVLASGDLVVSSRTALSVAAQDPTVNGVASGVALVLAGIDGAAPANGTFTLGGADGAHTIQMQATDNLGNAEVAHSTTVYLDQTPPATMIAVSPAPYAAPDGSAYLGASSLISFTAADPAVNGIASGVNQTQYAVDAASAAAAGGSFGLSEGTHTVAYWSVDNVGNAEAPKTAAYKSDLTPPISALTIGNPSAQLFNLEFIAPQTPLNLSATDPTSNGVASGVSKILYSLDGGPDHIYAAPFEVAAGSHTISYGAVDNAGNAETRRSVSLVVGPFLTDTIEAVTSVTLSGIAVVSGTVRTNGLFSASQNSVVNGSVAALSATLSGGANVTGSVTQGALTLPAQALDLSATGAWAATHNSNASIPASFSTNGALAIGANQTLTLAAGTYAFTDLSIAAGGSLAASGPVNLFLSGGLQVMNGARLNAAGQAGNLWIISGGAAANLADGSQSSMYLYAPLASVFIAGNTEFSGRLLGDSVSMIGVLDAEPPRTTLAIGTPQYGSSPPLFIAPQTPLSLSSVDDAMTVGDGAGVGVAAAYWSVDAGSFAVYVGSFTAGTDGLHWIQYYSVDKVGNTEAVHASSVAVDATTPASNLSIGAPQVMLASGDVVVSSRTALSVTAQDPVVNGVASGVAQVLTGIDGAAPAPSSGTFTLGGADGAHTIQMQATDNVGNAEVAHSTAVYLDQTPPATTIAVSPAPYAAPDGSVYLGASSLISFTATDPAVNGIASGVNETLYALDRASTAVAGGSFGLSEGAHTVTYWSVDNVGNPEAPKTATYKEDLTPPLSTLTIGSPSTQLFNVELITPQTPLSLSATDPVSNGVASGVSKIVYSLDGGPDQIYTAPFEVAAGSHTISYGAVDNAGNAETRRSVSLVVGPFLTDAIEAATSVTLSGRASVTGTVRTNGAFQADGGSSVNGNVWAMSISLAGRSAINGTATQSQAAVSGSAFDMNAARAWAQTNNNNAAIPAAVLPGGILTLTGSQQLTLAAGTYYLAGLSVSGQASLAISGSVFIFLDGPFNLNGGGQINAAGDAANLWMLEASGDAAISGGARVAFNLYAPNSNVSISGNGEFAGRILGNTVALSGKALEPSTTALPTHDRRPGDPAHFHPPQERPRSGTASRGKDHDADEDVLWSFLGHAPPAVVLGRTSMVSGLAAPSLAPAVIVVSRNSSHRASATPPISTSIPILSLAGTLVHLPPQPPRPKTNASSGYGRGQSQSVLFARIQSLAPISTLSGSTVSAVMPSINYTQRPSLSLDVASSGNISVLIAAASVGVSRTSSYIRTQKLTFPILNLSTASAFSFVHDDGQPVRTTSGSGVVIPSGALSATLGISVLPDATNDPRELAKRQMAADRLAAMAYGKAVDFGPTGTQFQKPVTLELAYDPSLLIPGVSENQLVIHYWNPALAQWEPLVSQVDATAHVVRAQTTHFSLYQILAVPPSAAPALAAPGSAFALGNVYVFPNPATGGSNPTIHVEAGTADQATIRIFNMAGQQVLETNLSGPPAVIDDGNGPKYAYEYTWSGHIPSGVYLYTVEAEKSGYGKLHASGKFGVVR